MKIISGTFYLLSHTKNKTWANYLKFLAIIRKLQSWSLIFGIFVLVQYQKIKDDLIGQLVPSRNMIQLYIFEL